MKLCRTSKAINFPYESFFFKGLLFSTNDCVSDTADLVRLWVHECQRVYGDKFIEEKDIDGFNKLLQDVYKKNFEVCSVFQTL